MESRSNKRVFDSHKHTEGGPGFSKWSWKYYDKRSMWEKHVIDCKKKKWREIQWHLGACTTKLRAKWKTSSWGNIYSPESSHFLKLTNHESEPTCEGKTWSTQTRYCFPCLSAWHVPNVVTHSWRDFSTPDGWTKVPDGLCSNRRV